MGSTRSTGRGSGTSQRTDAARTIPAPRSAPDRSEARDLVSEPYIDGERSARSRSRLRTPAITALCAFAVAGIVTCLAERVHLPPARGSVWPTNLLFGGAWLAFAVAVVLLRKVPARAAV